MITKVVLRNFKRFKEETIELDPLSILAGHNNSGKTTVIQAIAAWGFALREWSSSEKQERSIGLTRKEFSPVPLQEFNQLWTEKSTRLKKDEVEGKKSGPRFLEIEIHGEDSNGKWELAVEFNYVNKDQIYVRPKVSRDEIPDAAKKLNMVYIPSFSGINLEEHEVNERYQDTLIGQGKPGDILRNLLQEVYKNEESWKNLCVHIREIFSCELQPPSPRGQAFIICEYRPVVGGKNLPALEINTAGSGFQQVLLLLVFLYARPATIILIDEPDAHLHINLQSEMYYRLDKIVRERKGQLIIATHSEVLIEKTPPDRIISFIGKHPRRLSDSHDRGALQKAIELLGSLDLLRGQAADDKVLFLEGESDFRILRAWAKILKHRASKWFENKKSHWHNMRGKHPKEAREYFRALKAAFPKMVGFVLVDPNGDREATHGFDDNNPHIILGQWERYEIENYLIHPESIKRFVDSNPEDRGLLFTPSGEAAVEKMREIIPPVSFKDILKDELKHLNDVKGSEIILGSIFKSMKIRIGKNDYYRLAEVMRPEEIHDDVRIMLDKIADHFGIDEDPNKPL